MKRKLELFVKMFYDNNAVLKANKASLLMTVIVLFMNVALISGPNFVGLMQGSEQIHNLENVYEAFDDLYEYELPCHINEQSQMECEETGPLEFGVYTFRYVNSFSSDDLNDEDVEISTILFSKDEAAIVYIHDTNEEKNQIIQGDYSLLRGIDFSQVKSNSAESSQTETVYFYSYTTMFLEDIYYSRLVQNSLMVYTTQFFQFLLYTFFVSIMFMVLNFKAKFKKVNYLASFKITIFSATGPALLTAALGLFITAWAAMLFVVLYLIRVILVYFKINSVETTIH